MKVRPNRNPTPFSRPGVDPRIRFITQALDALSRKISDRGFLATPDMSMRDVIAQCGTKSDSGDINVFFSEGTWTFRDNFTISRPRVYLWGIPGATVFERHVDNGKPMLTLSGREVSLNGIRFEDSKEDTGAAIKVTGGRSSVSQCVFDDCYRAIEVAGGGGQRLLDNYVISCRATDFAIAITNRSTDGIASGNVIEQASLAADIFLDSGCKRWVLSGNQTFNGNIRYTETDGHVESGNSGSAAVETVTFETGVISREVFR